ncbi:hypothetical protein D9611_004317 [Ephemerocybe angulata]|uniref:Transcriptional regulatory protein n=1 Tax=Ephemerocybe angulata TaxID=980116 RepID=A0A8H5BJT6_9AGAR|nr:hypothetical protein D9611_004317 [Tulosesus angulatus]
MLSGLFARRTLATCPRSFSTTSTVLSGHNKWSKIKDRKGANDAQKGVLYGAANRDIIVAARAGGSPDPTKNSQLASIIRKYKDAGVPNANIEKALAKANPAKGKAGNAVVYEALAFGSVGIVVECLTDNATRTIHNVKHALTKHGAHMTPVKFMFERKGFVQLSLDAKLANLEEVTEGLIEAALGADAEDFEQYMDEEHPDAILLKFTSPPEALAKVTEAVTSSGVPSLHLQKSELIYSPVENVEPDEEMELQVADLVQELEADEDTLRIWTSLDSR